MPKDVDTAFRGYNYCARIVFRAYKRKGRRCLTGGVVRLGHTDDLRRFPDMPAVGPKPLTNRVECAIFGAGVL